jgi:hypothetical protein
MLDPALDRDRLRLVDPARNPPRPASQHPERAGGPITFEQAGLGEASAGVNESIDLDNVDCSAGGLDIDFSTPPERR